MSAGTEMNDKGERIASARARAEIFAFLARRRPKDARAYFRDAVAIGADAETLLDLADLNGADVSDLRREFSLFGARGNAGAGTEILDAGTPKSGEEYPRLNFRPTPSKNCTDPSLNFRRPPSKNLTQEINRELKGIKERERKKREKGPTPSCEGGNTESASTPSCGNAGAGTALSRSFLFSAEEKLKNESAGETGMPVPATKPPRESIFSENSGKLSHFGENAPKNGDFDENGNAGTREREKTPVEREKSAGTGKEAFSSGKRENEPFAAQESVVKQSLTTEKTENLVSASVDFARGNAGTEISFVRGNAVAGIDLKAGNVDTGERIIATAPFPKPFSLKKLLWGKRVAVVGNGKEETDHSAEIDACDVVIRFNHFYNYDSGNVGKKLDVLFITPSGAWLALKDDEARRKSIIQRERPIVAFTRFKERCQWATFQRVFDGIPYFYDRNTNASNNQFTTGVSVLELIAQSCENCEIKIFGFGDTDEKMWAYFEREGRHYLPNGFREAIVRERLLKILPRFRVFTSRKIEEVFPWESGTDFKGTPLAEIDGAGTENEK